MKTIAILVCTFFLLSLTPDSSRSLSPKDFKLKLEQLHGVLIDVRTAEEFLTETIPGAMNIDMLAADFSTRTSKLNRNKTYFLFCGTGMRSASALETMKKQGFMKLYELDGGLTAWQKYELPLE